MEKVKHLMNLGEETIRIEAIYLSLKIEKLMKGDQFEREALLNEAEYLWQEAKREYHSFLSYMQVSKAA